jgi:hypothetical protein
MKFMFNDGGRKAAGFRGSTGDCVTRAIAIATGKSYMEVYDDLNALAKTRRGKLKQSNARTGVRREVYQPYLEKSGWKWKPTMIFGKGCQVHLRAEELPEREKLIVAVSKHLTVVIDGVVFDTHDPSREGIRCVYGYYYQAR